jgi:hypothetical protein
LRVHPGGEERVQIRDNAPPPQGKQLGARQLAEA